LKNVILKGVTFPLNIEDIETPEDFIAYCARVSNPKNQANKETASKLLRYLIKHKHWSPFEMVDVVIEINTNRDIGRQILRHRSFSFQEFSQRYAEVDTTTLTRSREARMQDPDNRQNSKSLRDFTLQQEWDDHVDKAKRKIIDCYNWAIDNGIAKEVARTILPEGFTPTKMYMKGSLRSWIHYCALRMTKGTQKEHRDIAEACWKLVVEQVPALEGVAEDIRDEYERDNNRSLEDAISKLKGATEWTGGHGMPGTDMRAINEAIQDLEKLL